MRYLSLLLAVSVVGACSAFGADNSPAGPPVADRSDAGNGEGGGTEPVGGSPADLSLTIDPETSVLPIIQGASAKLKLTVKRGKHLTDPVLVKTRDLRDGVTSAPLTITGESGELVLAATAAAPQGPANGLIEAVSSTTKTIIALKTLVRGKPGDVDTTYAGGTVTNLFPGGAAYISALVLAPDDSVYLVAACAKDACVRHVAADGTMDQAYGIGGIGRLNVARPNAAALQSDGKLVIAGGDNAGGGNGLPASAGRLDALGKPDTTFGPAFSPGTTSLSTGGLNGENRGAYSVAIRADGDIFIAWDNYDPSVPCVKNAVMRLDSKGVLRPQFGTSGTARSAPGYTGAMTVRNNLASPSKGNLVWIWAGTAPDSEVVGIIQVNGDTAGQDSLFGPNYKKVNIPGFNSLNGDNRPAPLVELADGSIITGFGAGNLAIDGGYLLKFTPNGDRDLAFGVSGLAGPFHTSQPAPSVTYPMGLALQADGKIIVVGLAQGHGQEVYRFTPTGSLDTGFGQGGHVINNKVIGDQVTSGWVAVQKSGRILVPSTTAPSTTAGSALVAYWP